MPVIEDFMLQLDDATSGRREGVVVIGATNRIGAVDPAILRPGRLERAIEVTAPGPDGILNILRFHVRGSLSDEELRTAIGPLDGCTAAEIMETVRSARRKARQAGRDVLIGDLKDAALPEPELPPEVLYRIAVHEAGHVLTAYCCGLRVKSVRIGGRDGVGGVTRIEQSADWSRGTGSSNRSSVCFRGARRRSSCSAPPRSEPEAASVPICRSRRGCLRR